MRANEAVITIGIHVKRRYYCYPKQYIYSTYIRDRLLYVSQPGLSLESMFEYVYAIKDTFQHKLLITNLYV